MAKESSVVQTPTEGAAKPPRNQPKVDTSSLKSSYCNVCNAVSTREEVVLSFGVNQNWELSQGQNEQLEISLQHRIILSPFAAKRLQDVLSKLVKDYETRYGEMK
jgi:hypothetical protein